MNIIEFSESLQAKIKQKLDNLNNDQDELTRIGKTLAFIRELISELKIFTRNYKFQNQAEEIQFFKEVKPVFLSQYFYYKKVFGIRLVDSFKDVKSKQANYCQILQRLEAFVEKNLEFYEYCMSGNTSRDVQYFTRQNQSHKSLGRDENFSTDYDTKLAKVLANEQLKKEILNMLEKSQGNSLSTTADLIWTGAKTDLIELIYALQSTEVFNNGKADIKHIASAFQAAFNIDLGNYYRVFQDIRVRKTGLNFLDKVKSRLTVRINSMI